MKIFKQALAAFVCALGCAACTPSLNWREVRFDDGGIELLLPCKPDKAQRQIALENNGQAVSALLTLQGCEASDLQFTWGQISIPPSMDAKRVMAAWRLASLSALGVEPQEASVQNESVGALQKGVIGLRTQVQTHQHDSQLLWFANAGYVYQLAVYGAPKDKSLDDVAHVYFSGVKLP
jgi:hypothetical protein